jgi:putative tryptophan/tyrosine transport system substrate-binding protein
LATLVNCDDEVIEMRRRTVIAGIGLAAVHLSAARAEVKTYRLGILASTPQAIDTAMFKELRALGYVEGQNLVVERRFSQGLNERWPELAKELVALKVDAIVCGTTPAALAAKQATSTIPIIIPTAIDPVGAGLAESLARPGGNVTGGSVQASETSAKALSLLKQAVPGLSGVAVLWNAGNPAFLPVWQRLEGVAGSLDLRLAKAPVRELGDFRSTFAALAAQRLEGFLLLMDEFVLQRLHEIIEFASSRRLASASTIKLFTAAGGLMSYGPNMAAPMRLAARYLDRIFKGENPATLPFQQPTEFELVINLKTANVLGLVIPQLLLAQADDVIE